jgi:hypothetical protein
MLHKKATVPFLQKPAANGRASATLNPNVAKAFLRRPLG